MYYSYVENRIGIHCLYLFQKSDEELGSSILSSTTRYSSRSCFVSFSLWSVLLSWFSNSFLRFIPSSESFQICVVITRFPRRCFRMDLNRFVPCFDVLSFVFASGEGQKGHKSTFSRFPPRKLALVPILDWHVTGLCRAIRYMAWLISRNSRWYQVGPCTTTL